MLLSHISFAAAIIALLLSSHLSVVKAASRMPLVFLSLSFAFLGLQTLCLSLFVAGLEITLTRYLMPVFALSIGPSLALFTIGSSKAKWRLSFIHIIHYLPAISVLILRNWGPFANLIDFMILLSLLSYGLFMAFQTFKGPVQFANLLRYRNAAWHWQAVCSIIILLSFFGEIFINLELKSGLALAESWSLFIITLLKVALLLFIIFSVMTRSSRFEWVYVFGQSRYGKTPSTLVASEYLDEIEGFTHLLDEKKIYLEENTNLEAIAARLGTTQRHLSEAINLTWGESFSKVMNRRRVAEAQRLLLAYPKMRVSEVVYQSGFRNKSAFNHEFHAFTSMSPTAFRELHLKS